jgi:hypothetical protein
LQQNTMQGRISRNAFLGCALNASPLQLVT